MRLDTLYLKNYRCFDEIKIDFDERLTVLVAPNGGGKTAIIDGTCIALTPFVNGLGISDGKSFTRSDAAMRTVFADRQQAEIPAPFREITLHASCITESGEINWEIQKRTEKGRSTSKEANAVKNFGKSLFDIISDKNGASDTVLPIIACYGTGRLWGPHKKEKGSPKSSLLPRPDGYKGWASALSRFDAFHKWFYRAYLSVMLGRYQGKRGDPTQREHELLERAVENVRDAVRATLHPYGECWLEHRATDYTVVVNDHSRDTQLTLNQLSDGVQTIIGTVGDIASRTSLLNPQFGRDAARRTPGIVLIDEVDMHLHPSWQQRVLQSFQDAFPNIQFIVTTHSPQVLSTVKRENIRIIGPDASGKVIAAPPLAMTYGEPSGDVLQSVMMVDPQPPVVEKDDLLRLTELVDQGDYESQEAGTLMQDLRSTLGKNHPQLLRLERSIRRQEAMKK
jgi:predicted ATP-binding protein involved in virulence